MKINLTPVPRALMWTAAGIAVTALLMIIVIQIMTITLTTRPPMMTRWLTGLFVIGSQSIFASIALGISGYALYTTQRERVAARLVAPAPVPPAPRFPVASLSLPSESEQPKLPPQLRAAVAAASSEKNRR